jgi:uncharacterized membrane protein YhaH (DUF805 family)
MDTVSCHACGEQIDSMAHGCPGCGASQPVVDNATFVEKLVRTLNWYVVVLKKYATFSGRARRKEYWYFYLFNLIIAIVLGLMSGPHRTGLPLAGLYNFAVVVPHIAVGVRRLHDSEHSGWWILVPFANLILLCRKGTIGSNKYGADPITG